MAPQRSARVARLLGVAALGVAPFVASHAAAADGGTVGAPVSVGIDGNEPIVKVAPDGTLYVSALEFLYLSRDDGATWFRAPSTIYNGPAPQEGVNLNSDSSIDVDPGGRLYMTFDYPYAGVTAVCTSDDRAQHFSCDPKTVPGGTDRMWLTTPSPTQAYLTTNEALYQTLFFSSTDRGGSFAPQGTTDDPANPDIGPLVALPDGHVLQPYVENNTNESATDNELSGPLMVYDWDPAKPSTPAAKSDTHLPAGAAINDLAATPDGTAYVASETPSGTDEAGAPSGKQVQVSRSTDGGHTWTVLPALPGTTTGTAAFSWVAAGADGHVGVLYYRTGSGGRADTATGSWDVLWAETTDAESATPHWTVQTVERDIHHGHMCTTAGCSGSDRFSGDFIGATFDPAGRAKLTWVRELPGGSTEVRYAGTSGPPTPGPSLPEVPLVALLPVAAAGALWAAGRRLARRSVPVSR